MTSVEDALDAVADLAAGFGALVDTGTRRLGLTPVRARVVFALHEDGPSRQRALGQSVGVSAQQLAVIVDALVDKGLVRRDPDPEDRRALRVSLTAAGESAAAEIAAVRREIGEVLLGDFDEERRDTLVTLCATMTDRAARVPRR
ncbi:MarR family winged helix-turn-helix transcriptional regulator [Mobilicoccus caccae]|uniref:HTH marR-type domain-containing protein n=1 Tax=Mobilicoccus caccae TaxID=1859295 RepID=A0ABQ6ILV5_9MICO|nr:MarR family transcriptional regulator [Mobilicoccus caccae]GMA38086.1 hypothetical protein GCM10025883_01310 [Mobilicoccus caccae]